MRCNCSIPTDEYHGYECAVMGGSCAFLVPDPIACAINYGEGPLSDKTKDELWKLAEEGESIMYTLSQIPTEIEPEDDEDDWDEEW